MANLENSQNQYSAHHNKAAEYLEHAIKEHRHASREYDSGNHDKASHHAHAAHGHHLHALTHMEEAHKLYATQHSKK
jgi:HEPN domain-containing protein